MKIQLLYPVVPPVLDGIGDYTALMASTLAPSHDVGIITGRHQTPASIPGVKLWPIFGTDSASYARLIDHVKTTQPDWLILQYNPFGYGRYGFNLTLPRVMRRIRNQCRATKIAMMAHECYVPWGNWKYNVMRTWQRWQFRHLSRTAEVVFVSTEAWAALSPAKIVKVLPVGSNIPRIAIPRDEARQRLGIKPEQVVLGIFGSAHPSRLFHMVRAAADSVRQAGRDVLVLYIGAEGAVVRQQMGDVPCITDGPLPPDEVSRRLSAIDVALSPYIDGVSSRRGAFIAALEHGLPSVVTRGANTDTMIARTDGAALLMVDVDQEAFNQAIHRLLEHDSLRRSIANGGRLLFEQEFAWPAISQRMVQTLQDLS